VRICYLSKLLINHDHRFLTKLVERGYETYLVTYYLGETLPDDIRAIKGLKIIHHRPKDLMGIQKFLLWAQVFDFRRILRELEPDVLHSGFVWSDGFLAALSGFHPHLSMPWGTDILEHAERYLIARMITRYTFERAEMITVDAEIVKEKIIALSHFPSDRIVVFPWGLELDRFKPGIDGMALRRQLGWEDKKILIMTRLLRPIYGIPYFLRAFARVVKEIPAARAILAGTGPLESELRNLVSQLGLERFVHFAGWVSPKDMPTYLRAADIYVSSSLSDGSSMSMLEAMACGLPVIVTEIPAILEWVQDGVNGLVVPPRDSARLAERLCDLLRNPESGKVMARQNRVMIEARADWNKNFAKLEEMYHTLGDSIKPSLGMVGARLSHDLQHAN